MLLSPGHSVHLPYVLTNRHLEPARSPLGDTVLQPDGQEPRTITHVRQRPGHVVRLLNSLYLPQVKKCVLLTLRYTLPHLQDTSQDPSVT